MRRVFSNAQCAHVWAQQTQSDGRGPSVKFEGDTFYSYRTPIARFVRNAAGNMVALCTSERYSVTTEGKHKNHVRRALRGDVHVFTVPDLFPDGDKSWRDRGMSRFPSHRDADHSGNVQHYLHRYAEEKAALLRVPCESWRVSDNAADYVDGTLEVVDIPTRAHSTLRELAVTFEHYSRTFALGLAAPDWRADAAEVIARRDKLASDPKRAAKREKAAAARTARELKFRADLGLPPDASRWQVKSAQRQVAWNEQRPARIAEWRAGAAVSLRWDDTPDGDLLRVSADGKTVQTSRGADAPVSHVRPALAFWLRSVRDVVAYTRGERSIRLGHFSLDAIDLDGNVRAGCHKFAAAEVRALVELLGATVSSDAA